MLRNRRDALLAIGLGIASFVVYLRTLAPTILPGDSGEFQFAAYLLGAVHPTGYPLYLLLGWLWTHLVPFGDVAFRMNLFSAVWAALAVSFFYLATYEATQHLTSLHPFSDRAHLGVQARHRPAAIVATLTLAFSVTFWSQAVKAEVYALNSFFVVVIMWLLLRWSRQSSVISRQLSVLAFIYGLSLTHHRTMILLAPAFLLFIWLAKPHIAHRISHIMPHALRITYYLSLFFLPLLLYLYIPLRAPVTPYLHIELAPGHTLELYSNTPTGFVDFILGRVFAFDLGSIGPLDVRIALAASLLWQQFSPLGIGLSLLGLAALIASRRWPLVALTLAAYIAVIGFCLIYGIGDIADLFTPSYLVFALWIGCGTAALLDWLNAHIVTFDAPAPIVGRGALLGAGASVALLLLPVGLLVTNFTAVDRSGDRFIREQWELTLAQPIPHGAILVSNDRDEITPMWYLQQIEGKRGDLIGLFPLIVPGDDYANVGRVIDSVLDVGRPVYLIKPMPGLDVKFRLASSDTLVCVVGPAVTGEPQHVRSDMLNGRLRLAGYDALPEIEPGGSFEITLYWRVEQPVTVDYTSYVHLVDPLGQTIAQSDHRVGGKFYPTSLWRSSETLRDVHRIVIPADAAPGQYRLEVGMYAYPSLERLGQPIDLSIDSPRQRW